MTVFFPSPLPPPPPHEKFGRLLIIRLQVCLFKGQRAAPSGWGGRGGGGWGGEFEEQAEEGGGINEDS